MLGDEPHAEPVGGHRRLLGQDLAGQRQARVGVLLHAHAPPGNDAPVAPEREVQHHHAAGVAEGDGQQGLVRGRGAAVEGQVRYVVGARPPGDRRRRLRRHGSSGAIAVVVGGAWRWRRLKRRRVEGVAGQPQHGLAIAVHEHERAVTAALRQHQHVDEIARHGAGLPAAAPAAAAPARQPPGPPDAALAAGRDTAAGLEGHHLRRHHRPVEAQGGALHQHVPSTRVDRRAQLGEARHAVVSFVARPRAQKLRAPPAAAPPATAAAAAAVASLAERCDEVVEGAVCCHVRGQRLPRHDVPTHGLQQLELALLHGDELLHPRHLPI